MSLGALMIGLAGAELEPVEREMLLHPLVGGVVLFSRNFVSPEQLVALTAEIHALREPRLLIAVDHEGGRVQRFHSGFTLLPAVAGLGQHYEQNPRQANILAERSGWLMAAELRSVGVDFSFAPVLDLDRGISTVIGDRAFHRDPEVVANLAQHYVQGMKRAGMAATAKHFPGHGAVQADSHTALPVDQRPYGDLQLEDLRPFERLSHLGIEAVMSAHVCYQKIDPAIASYSPFWLQEVLRRRLGFQGLVFSDDLDMAAAAIGGSMAERVRLALQAGCDMVLVCQRRESMAQVLDGPLEWHNPVSQLRQARMHGQGAVSREELHADPAWQEAVSLIEKSAEPHTLDLL